MSTAGLIKWQAVLTAKKIGTANQLLAKSLSIDSEPTARKALKGGRLDKKTWESIFQDLDLNRGDFFTDAEWHEWSLETRWEMLLNLAEDASARFGLVFPQQLEHAGFGDLFRQERFQTSIPSGKSVLLEIPAGLSGYLILVEQDPNGEICLVAPSCLVMDSSLTGELRLLPQHPPSPFKVLKPSTLGTSYLWAGIFAQLPDWKWLQALPGGLLKLEMEQITQLVEYAETQPRETTQIWKSSYTVTAA
jgi:hypothetical protein